MAEFVDETEITEPSSSRLFIYNIFIVRISVGISLGLGVLLVWWGSITRPQPIGSVGQKTTPAVYLDLNNVEGTGYSTVQLDEFGNKAEALAAAQADALVAAKADAIRKALGEFIVAETIVQDFKTVRYEIRSQAQGFVDNVRVIATPKLRGDRMECKILCRIRADKILDKIQLLRPFRNFLRRRVVVMVPKSLTNEGKLAGCQQLARHLKAYLRKKGFRIFVEEMALASFQAVAEGFHQYLSQKQYRQVMKLATDLVIIPTLSAYSVNGHNTLQISVVARNRVGNTFAEVTPEFPVKNLDSPGMWREAINQHQQLITAFVYREIVQYISQIGGGDEYTLYLQNYDQDTLMRVQNILQTVPELTAPIKTLDQPQQMTTRIDMAALQDPRMYLQQQMKAYGIPYRFSSMGNWFFFVKPDRVKLAVCIVIAVLLVIGCLAMYRRCSRNLSTRNLQGESSSHS